MNVEPMPETLSLRELILRNQPLVEDALRGRTDLEAGSARLAPALPFAGRGLELEHLRTMWSRAARGSGSVAFIRGEAGIIKTLLASELALRAEAEGARFIIGGTADPETVPYQALVEALR